MAVWLSRVRNISGSIRRILHGRKSYHQFPVLHLQSGGACFSQTQKPVFSSRNISTFTPSRGFGSAKTQEQRSCLSFHEDDEGETQVTNSFLSGGFFFFSFFFWVGGGGELFLDDSVSGFLRMPSSIQCSVLDYIYIYIGLIIVILWVLFFLL